MISPTCPSLTPRGPDIHRDARTRITGLGMWLALHWSGEPDEGVEDVDGDICTVVLRRPTWWRGMSTGEGA